MYWSVYGSITSDGIQHQSDQFSDIPVSILTLIWIWNCPIDMSSSSEYDINNGINLIQHYCRQAWSPLIASNVPQISDSKGNNQQNINSVAKQHQWMLQLNTRLHLLLLYLSSQPGNATAIECLVQHCYHRFTTAIQARALCSTAIQARALFKPIHSRREILSLRSPKQEWEPGHQPSISQGRVNFKG